MKEPYRQQTALIEQIHKRWLRWALRRVGGDRIKAARVLGISPRTVTNWMRRFDLYGEFPGYGREGG